MYYETYRKKSKGAKKAPKRRGRRRLLKALFRLLAILIALTVVCALALYALPVSMFMVEPEGVTLSLTPNLPTNRINILLLGADELSQSTQRSDAILIASVGYGTLKLTSVLRDTWVDIPGHGPGKLNSAYAYGGPELLMRVLNETFDLNIMHYICADYVTLVELVDAIGGIDVEVSEAEMNEINAHLGLYEAGSIFRPMGYTAQPITAHGDSTHLTGLQALAVSRVRHLDTDIRRTGRQRVVLLGILNKIKSRLWNPFMLVRLARSLLKNIDTNLSTLQLISLGEKLLVGGKAATLPRMPIDGSFEEVDYALRITDRQANIDAFRAFVYD